MLALLLALAVQDPEPPDLSPLPVLRSGETIEGEIADGDPLVHTETLDTRYSDGEPVAKTFRIAVATGGLHHVELRSYVFDAYLVLRDAEGRVLSEDDDGLIGFHSRVVATLAPGEEYTVDACALRGRRGPFGLTLQAGPPPLLTQPERAAATREEARRGVAVLDEMFGPEHPQTAQGLNELAIMLADMGDDASARRLYERSLSIREKVLGPEHAETATSLGNLATLLVRQGDRDRAFELYERSLAILQKTLGPEHPQTATALSVLAGLHQRRADYAAARPLLERALVIREGHFGPDSPITAKSLNNLAGLLHALDDHDGARPLFERALAIQERAFGPDSRYSARTLNNLAILIEEQGEFDAAAALYERSLRIFERVYGPDHASTARSLDNLAGLLKDTGEVEEARRLYQRALAIWEETRGPDHPDTAVCLNNLAVLVSNQAPDPAAVPMYERVLAIREDVLGLAHPETATALDNLATLLLDLGQPARAWKTIRRGHEQRARRRTRTLAVMSEGERYRNLAQQLARLEVELSVAMALGQSAEHIVAYEDLIQWKGGVGRMLSAGRAKLAEQMTAEQRRLVERLRTCQAELSSVAFATSDRPPAEREDDLRRLREERNRIELELHRSAEEPPRAPSISFAQLHASLPERSAVLDFLVHITRRPARREDGEVIEHGYWSGQRLSVWITTPAHDQPLHVDLGAVAPIESAIRSYLGSLVARPDPGSDPRGVGVVMEAGDKDAGARLRTLLWAPIARHFADSDVVFVSPDGPLGTLPFEVLPMEDGSLAVERRAFVYVQDLVSVARSGERGNLALDSVLAIGGVDYPRTGFADAFGALPATKAESRRVFELHREVFGDAGQQLLLQGGAPTEARLKRELSNHAALHLATHGFFNPEGLPSMWETALRERDARPGLADEARHLVGKLPGLLSGLVCADERGAEDGYLTAEEVAWLDLSGVELVVLSACETGLGRAQSGEGLIGLRRAFRTAGAKTVISSLWSVKDESTAELMQAFYANLWVKQMGRLESLRQAQLELLNKNRAEHGNALPANWGAFVLSGEWR
jgi:CHAT domain-containing protein/tetratricopeptide (TPR) repeat protein